MKKINKQKLLIIQPAIFKPRITDDPLNPEGEYNKTSLPVGLISLVSYMNMAGYPSKLLLMDTFFESLAPEGIFYDGTHQSEIMFAKTNEKVIRKIIDTMAPDVVGVSITAHDMEYGARVIIRILRKLYPEIKIVLGGVHVTFTARKWYEIYLEEQPDFIVLGEGEQVLSYLLENDFRISEVFPGLMYKDANENIISGGLAHPVDLKYFSAPFDYELCIVPNEYRYGSPFCVTLFTRGCVGSCTYCLSPVLHRQKIRERPISHVISDLKSLQKYIATKLIIFVWDDMFMPSKECYRTACNVLKEFGMFEYHVASSFYCLSPSDIKLFRISNINSLIIGLQHTDRDVLKRMCRGFYNSDRAFAVLKACRENRIGVSVDVLFGCPGSTFKKDIQMLEHIKGILDAGLIDYVSPKIMQPYPGTRVAHDPSIRIIDENMNRWEFHRASHELLDEHRNVVYTKEQMEEAYRISAQIITERNRADSHWLNKIILAT